MKVALLDAGPILPASIFDQSSNKPETASSFSQAHRIYLLLTGERKKALNTATRKQTHEFFLSEKEHPYTVRGTSFNWSRVRAVGGRGHFWGRVMLRYSDRDLSGCWPITYEELSPYYCEVETALELGGDLSKTEQVPDGCYQRRRALSSEEKAFCSAVAKRWPERQAVVNHVAEYEPGPLSPMLRIASATGNLQILPEIIAVKLQNVVTGHAEVCTLCANTGQERVFSAGNVVLAASAFETVRLLLNSQSTAFPQGLGNSNGLLGRGILEHIVVSTFAKVPLTAPLAMAARV
jgi:choline dehydrogenase-like flavoprotein